MKFLVFLTFITTVFAAVCEEGYFSKGTQSCNYACSDGCKDNKCNDNGVCTTPTCEAGWKNSKDNDGDCSSPICFADRPEKGCSEGGKCVYPNTCICGASGAQIVAKEVFVDGKSVGYDCVSLRKDGIIGALVALVVMSVSISTCGFIAEKRGAPK